MQKDLCATTYRNGTPLTKQVELGKGAGYFKPEKDEIYFYNGEAILAGNLAPEGWKIPNNGDWDSLRQYIKNDISVLKQEIGYHLRREISYPLPLTRLD